MLYLNRYFFLVLLLPTLFHVFLLREESQKIADIFLSRKSEFLVFTTYIGHYDRSMSLLEDSCRTSPAFAAIVQQFEVSFSYSKHAKHSCCDNKTSLRLDLPENQMLTREHLFPRPSSLSLTCLCNHARGPILSITLPPPKPFSSPVLKLCQCVQCVSLCIEADCVLM